MLTKNLILRLTWVTILPTLLYSQLQHLYYILYYFYFLLDNHMSKIHVASHHAEWIDLKTCIDIYIFANQSKFLIIDRNIKLHLNNVSILKINIFEFWEFTFVFFSRRPISESNLLCSSAESLNSNMKFIKKWISLKPCPLLKILWSNKTNLSNNSGIWPWG